MSDYKILVVDDEPDLREILQCNLENAGYSVDTAPSAEEALRLLTPDHSLILLDVMMGGMSGFRMAEHLRKELKNPIPIIFLTAKDTERDLLAGFQAGGDDYIAKPFSVQEVLARIKAILRRAVREEADAEPKELRIDNICLDFGRKIVAVNGEDVRLSPKEFGILCMLVQHPGRIYSREEIVAKVWRGETYVLDRTVDVHIARIRRKLGTESGRIINRQGYGYCFN